MLAGCATTEKYEGMLQSLIGSTEHDLIRQWGPPQQAYDAGGGVKYLTYQDARQGYLPGTSSTSTTTYNPYTNTATTTKSGGSPAQFYDLSCQRIFEIQDGYVASWRWKGNDCKSK